MNLCAKVTTTVYAKRQIYSNLRKFKFFFLRSRLIVRAGNPGSAKISAQNRKNCLYLLLILLGSLIACSTKVAGFDAQNIDFKLCEFCFDYA